MIRPMAFLGLFEWLLFAHWQGVRIVLWYGKKQVDITSSLCPSLFDGFDVESWPRFDVRGWHILTSCFRCHVPGTGGRLHIQFGCLAGPVRSCEKTL